MNDRARIRPSMRPRNRVVRSYRTGAALLAARRVDRARANLRYVSRLWHTDGERLRGMGRKAHADYRTFVETCEHARLGLAVADAAIQMAIENLRSVTAKAEAEAEAASAISLLTAPPVAFNLLPPPADPGDRKRCRRLPGVPQLSLAVAA